MMQWCIDKIVFPAWSVAVQVWLPEADGPINPADPAHQALMMRLGHQSEREVLRSRFRTTHAMRAWRITSDPD